MSMPQILTALDTTTTSAEIHLLEPLTERSKHQCQPSVDGAAVSIAAAQIQSQYLPDLSYVPQLDENSNCTPTYRAFSVQLNLDLEPNELVALTGSSMALGEWQLERAVPLRRFGALQWSANVLLQQSRNVTYRYFTYVLDAQGKRLVRRWETQMEARALAEYVEPTERHVDRFGEIAPQENSLKRGWLTSECIVQLKFEREKMFQVLAIDKFDAEQLLIKLVPDGDVIDAAGLSVEVSKLRYGESQLQPQPAFGIDYKRGDVVVFHLTMPQALLRQAAFALVFHTPQRKPLGRAVFTAAQLQGSEGELQLNVELPDAKSDEKLAQLTLPYLVVQPLRDAPAPLNFRSSFAHYWPRSWPVLDVGHRGNGRSFKASQAPTELENTIASFKRAYVARADMIELDVQLTADGVPIIWHDFVVKTAPHGKEVTSADQLESVLIKDLTYGALKELRVFAVIGDAQDVCEYPSHNAQPLVEQRVFPRLQDVLNELPLTLGIDVEIKWPQRQACGGVEAVQSLDKNFFVDRVLQTVLQNGGNARPLIFSSFDADICTMLRFKQNLLPVMFLTMGQTKKWKPFMDLRTRNFEQAVNFAQALELAGTAPHAEDFLGAEGRRLMQLARDAGQIVVVWGDDVNSRERVKYFSDLGATATCYDRADLYMPCGKKQNFFETQLPWGELSGQKQQQQESKDEQSKEQQPKQQLSQQNRGAGDCK